MRAINVIGHSSRVCFGIQRPKISSIRQTDGDTDDQKQHNKHIHPSIPYPMWQEGNATWCLWDRWWMRSMQTKDTFYRRLPRRSLWLFCVKIIDIWWPWTVVSLFTRCGWMAGYDDVPQSLTKWTGIQHANQRITSCAQSARALSHARHRPRKGKVLRLLVLRWTVTKSWTLAWMIL